MLAQGKIVAGMYSRVENIDKRHICDNTLKQTGLTVHRSAH
jgi:hypothetical protein